VKLACTALLVLFAACEFEKVGIPRTDARLAVHAVLSATASTQVVLLERTRNGSVYPVGPSFELLDPIGSDQGIAESGAMITMTTPSGQTLVAIEEYRVRDDGKGRGVYRFGLPGSLLERNGTYKLKVTTLIGEVLTAETSVPAGAVATTAVQRTFDRTSDAMIVEWPATPRARSYFVRIETPFGPRSFFTDSTRVRLGGELRNPDISSLPHVFIPGFPQAITVSAVDSNYYDWYRTDNDVISGSGLVNRVQGGLGVFGSLVRLDFRNVKVIEPQTEPVEGVFQFVGSQADRESTPYLMLELYVESPSARSDQGDALSGQFERRLGFGQPPDQFNGLLGNIKNKRIELAFLANWSAKDTLEVFDGEIRGDTIVGGYRGFGGNVHFVRKR
jgi:hypothetical protein